MARSVGIDFGSHSVKVLGLETHGKRFRITRFFDRPLPRTPEEGTAPQLVAKMFKEGKLPRDLVVMGFDAYASIIREMTVPFKNPDQIRKIIKYESEGQLFSFGIDEVVVDFVKVRETLDSSDLIVIAVVKELLAEKLKVVEDAYVDPISVDLDLLGHFNSLSITPYVDEYPTFALVDVGYKSSNILVIEKKNPILLRGIRVGMASIVNAIQQETSLSLPAAEAKVFERLPEVAGTLEPDLPAGDLEDMDDMMVVLPDDEELPERSDLDRDRQEFEDELLTEKIGAVRDKLVRELKRSLASLNTAEPISLILLTGGGSRIPGIEVTIEESLGISTKPYDILDHVEHPFSEEERPRVEPFISASLGLALKPLGRDASRTEFRREELVFRKRFEQIKVPLVMCLVLLLGFLGLVLFRFRSEFKLRRQEYDQLTWQMVHTMAVFLEEPSFQRFFDPRRKDDAGNPIIDQDRIPGPRLRRHRKLRSMMRTVREGLDRDMGRISESEVHHCALDTWNEVFKRIRLAQKKLGYDDPEAAITPIIPSIRFDQNGATCNIIVRDYNETKQLEEAFAESKMLEMKEERLDKPAKGVEGPNPRILTQQRFEFRAESVDE
jgi:type IV pilus assembly protein PilM